MPLPSLLHGGGQEKGLRAGTEAVPNLVALGAAADIWRDEGDAMIAHVCEKRDALRASLVAALGPDRCAVNGPLGAGDLDRALPNVLSFAVRGVVASQVLVDVAADVAASASAACHTGTVGISSVLKAVGVDYDLAVGTLRLSVGRHTTDDDVARASHVLLDAIERADARGHDALNKRLTKDAAALVNSCKAAGKADHPKVQAAEATVRKAYSALRKLDKAPGAQDVADAAVDAIDAAVAAAKAAKAAL